PGAHDRGVLDVAPKDLNPQHRLGADLSSGLDLALAGRRNGPGQRTGDLGWAFGATPLSGLGPPNRDGRMEQLAGLLGALWLRSGRRRLGLLHRRRGRSLNGSGLRRRGPGDGAGDRTRLEQLGSAWTLTSPWRGGRFAALRGDDAHRRA